MNTEQFERLLCSYVSRHDAVLWAQNNLDRCEAQDEEEHLRDKLIKACRAAWENRIPGETLSLTVTEPGTVVRIVEHHAGLWAATAQQPPFASAFGATPALALEAWRKENEK